MTNQSNDYQTITFPSVDYETWKKEAEKSLKGKTIEQLSTHTYENIALKPIYTKDDIKNLPHVKEVPGFDSKVRGGNSTGYIAQPWLISQQIDVETPIEFNKVIKEALVNGQTMIHVVLKNNDDSEEGLSLDTIEDLNIAFKDISLSTTPVFIDTYNNLIPFLTRLTSYLEGESMTTSTLKGTIGMDPIGSLVTRGRLSIPLSTAFDQLADSIKWAKEHTTIIRTILVKGQPYHNGGANAVQELAYTLATGTEYLNELSEKGLSINEIANRMTFSFSIGSNVFMEIAKLRAARMMWSTIVEAFGGNPETVKMHIHGRTSSFTKTKYDPYVNMLRSTTEAFSAIIGGIDSLHVSPFDEPFSKSNSFSRRIARNTQSILKEESHLNRVIDPAGGSWYIEALTHELAEKAWDLFKEVEACGGLVKALEAGIVQDAIMKVFNERQHNVNLRRDKIVGTNVYANISEETAHQKSIQDLNTGKEDIQQDAPTIRKIPQLRMAESFETLRNASEEYLRTKGERPKVGLLNLGPIPEHKPRADFITSFFEAGGYQVVKNDGFLTVEDAIEGAKNMNLSAFVYCGRDDLYQDMVSAISKELIAYNSNIKLYIAGKQKEDLEQEYRKDGIKDFIHIKTNCYSFLYDLHQELGVLPNEQ